MSETRVLIIAENFLTRIGLASLLSAHTNLIIVGQVSGSDTLFDDLDVYRPDVLVWDLSWNADAPSGHLAALIEEMSSSQPLPILALIADETQAVEVAALIGLVHTGGILLHDSDPDLFIAAISAVVSGLLVIDPALGDMVLPNSDTTPEPPAEALTPRELEVLRLLAEGLANKAIAQHLNISDHTVKFHVNAIMGKLHAQSRTEAVVRATRLGVIML